MRDTLSGITVVSIEQAVAAPLCTARLAEAGARVIKIERAEGDFARHYDGVVNGDSAFFVWLNRGKESIALDLKARADLQLLHRMIAKADVFVQNLAPGAAARGGFGSAELRLNHPELITCDVSGYGESGPYREMKAYDLLIQCESGLTSVTGGPEAPGRVGISIADISCGVTAHGAVIEALFARVRTGVGTGLAVSLFDCLAEWMSVPLLHHDYGAGSPARIGIRHPILAPYGLYESGDGEAVAFGVQNEREWSRFCTVVLEDQALAFDPRLATNALRAANRSYLDERLSKVLQLLTRTALIERLQRADIAYGALNSVADLSAHPQLRRARGFSPGGEFVLPGPPVRWQGVSDEPMASPRCDEHGASLRAEFA